MWSMLSVVHGNHVKVHDLCWAGCYEHGSSFRSSLDDSKLRMGDFGEFCNKLGGGGSLGRKPRKRVLKGCDRDAEVQAFTVVNSGVMNAAIFKG